MKWKECENGEGREGEECWRKNSRRKWRSWIKKEKWTHEEEGERYREQEYVWDMKRTKGTRREGERRGEIRGGEGGGRGGDNEVKRRKARVTASSVVTWGL